MSIYLCIYHETNGMDAEDVEADNSSKVKPFEHLELLCVSRENNTAGSVCIELLKVRV